MRRRENLRRNKVKIIKTDNLKYFVSIGIIILIVLFILTGFSMINLGSKNIINRVRIGDIDVSNLTQEEAIEKLENWKKNSLLRDIKVKYNDFEETINVQEISPEVDITKLVRSACNIGKSGNVIRDNFKILSVLLFSQNIDLDLRINEDKLNKKIAELNSKLPNAMENYNYYIEDNNLIIKKGKTGNVINEENFKQEFINILTKESKEIDLKIVEKEPEKINVEKIHNEIYKETKNAYVSQDPVEVHPEVNGIDFSISIEEAKKIISEDKEEYVIPLKITTAEITLDEIGKEAFPNLLGTFSTTYDTKNSNRENNIKLASNKIDETIIMPGEEFSYNKVVGERTIAAGYKEAAVYSGGKVVDGIGGGICQLSSTLYNAVLYANLEVTERSNHRFLTSYVEAGRDATVSWGTVDFCFINTRKYPIKVKTKVKNGVVTAEIYGIMEEKEYDIIIQNNVDEVLQCPVSYVKDYNLDEGTEEIKQHGANGAISTTYKIVKYKGVEISRELLSSDTYSPLEKIVIKGCKKVEPTSSSIFAESLEEEEDRGFGLEEINPEILELIKEL